MDEVLLRPEEKKKKKKRPRAVFREVMNRSN